MRFQLVLQWPASSLSDFDEIANIEDLLIAKLKGESEVDGHDFGSGEANIFVQPDDPHQALEEIRAILSAHRLWPGTAIAYDSDKPGAKKIFVRREDESLAREIVREIIEGTPLE